MTDIAYVPATAADIPAIFAQSRALIERYEDLDSIDPDAVFAWVRRKLDKCIGEYSRILCDGELAGWIRAHEAEGKLELDDLYILPAYQNRGIGTATLRRYMRESELPIFFYVFTRNTEALRLYERLGFRVVQTVGPTRVIMAWEAT